MDLANGGVRAGAAGFLLKPFTRYELRMAREDAIKTTGYGQGATPKPPESSSRWNPKRSSSALITAPMRGGARWTRPDYDDHCYDTSGNKRTRVEADGRAAMDGVQVVARSNRAGPTITTSHSLS